MVKITLYNIGEYKKKQFLYCFVGLLFVYSDIYLETRILMLRILPLRVKAFSNLQRYLFPRAKAFSNLQRYPFSHIASTLYLNQSMMASLCKLNKNNFYVHVYKKNQYAIIYIYIYIIYRNIET